jgi:demethylmenaquinone methyltransferase/2-methoxy-6-polyprenyl-1,4-benzoquinol methylase
MTFGQDQKWRRQAIRQARLPRGGRLLDVGAGTGGLALAALGLDPGARVTAADFTLEMIRIGRQRIKGRPVIWCGADALHLPFGESCFDAVVCGYLLRNVADLNQALAEQVRVVKPGGRVVCLDTCPPARGLLYPLVRFHLGRIIPWLGRLVAGDAAAYAYLPESTINFLTPGRMDTAMRSAGLTGVTHRVFMLGTVAIHAGIRPGPPR